VPRESSRNGTGKDDESGIWDWMTDITHGRGMAEAEAAWAAEVEGLPDSGAAGAGLDLGALTRGSS
jgi:hypothetical protein